jgi:hypothetical protein
MMRRGIGLGFVIAMALASAGACSSDDSGGSGGAGGTAGTGGTAGSSGTGGQGGSSGSTGGTGGTNDSGTPDADAAPGDAAGGSSGNDSAADAPPSEDCKNGVDDDGDSAVDCADSSCKTSTDCGELEQCGDSTDNDSDGFSDCADSECGCATSCGGPSCPSGTASPGTGAVNIVNTAGACHAYAGSCSPAASPEKTLSFTSTTAGQYYISLTGLTAQAVVFVRQGDCNGTELSCKIAPSFNGAIDVLLNLGASETVIIFVESTSTATGMFDLIVDKVP